jgi:polysaccharide pyruvyl transferase WcaK-like protein
MIHPLQLSAGPRPDARVRVGLLGMYASANLGDTAIQMAVMQALTARRPELEFIGLCTAPEDAVRTFGIRARHLSCEHGMLVPHVNGSVRAVPAAADAGINFERLPAPVARCLSAWRIHRQMRELDMLLVSGSGQIDDFWGGPWEQPFRLLAWTSAAQRQHKPAAVFGVGVDQLLTRLGTAFCKQALQRAQMRVLRDAGSLDALRAMGLQADTDVCPDPAFHLLPPPAHAASGRFAVISPIARNAWPGGSEPYEAYLAALAAAADHLQRQSVEVRFVCSQTRMDPPIIDRVKERMQGDAAATRVMDARTVDEYMHEVVDALVVVGSRLHAVILALVAGAPVVAVSYARKVQRQVLDIGLGDYLLDMQDVRADDLLARIDRALLEQDALRAHIRRRTAEFRGQLDERFDRLAALIPAPAR